MGPASLRVLREFVEWQDQHPLGRQPCAADLAGSLGLSKRGVHFHLEQLVAAGLMDHPRAAVRAYTVTPAGWAAIPVRLPCRRCGKPVDHLPAPQKVRCAVPARAWVAAAHGCVSARTSRTV